MCRKRGSFLCLACLACFAQAFAERLPNVAEGLELLSVGEARLGGSAGSRPAALPAEQRLVIRNDRTLATRIPNAPYLVLVVLQRVFDLTRRTPGDRDERTAAAVRLHHAIEKVQLGDVAVDRCRGRRIDAAGTGGESPREGEEELLGIQARAPDGGRPACGRPPREKKEFPARGGAAPGIYVVG